jgi:hypothetical protein
LCHTSEITRTFAPARPFGQASRGISSLVRSVCHEHSGLLCITLQRLISAGAACASDATVLHWNVSKGKPLNRFDMSGTESESANKVRDASLAVERGHMRIGSAVTVLRRVTDGSASARHVTPRRSTLRIWSISTAGQPVYGLLVIPSTACSRSLCRHLIRRQSVSPCHFNPSTGRHGITANQMSSYRGLRRRAERRH